MLSSNETWFGYESSGQEEFMLDQTLGIIYCLLAYDGNNYFHALQTKEAGVANLQIRVFKL